MSDKYGDNIIVNSHCIEFLSLPLAKLNYYFISVLTPEISGLFKPDTLYMHRLNVTFFLFYRYMA